MTSKIIETANMLFDYLGLEPIEIKYEDLGIEDSRFYIKDLYISINEKYKGDEIEILKCLIHEIKHYHQLACIAYEIDVPFVNEWRKEFKAIIPAENGESLCQMVEVDAYAFTKHILKEWFNIEYHHSDSEYDKVLDLVIEKSKY